MLIEFTRDWMGHTKGTRLDVDGGIADAYVNYAGAAVFVGEDRWRGKRKQKSREKKRRQ